MTIQITLLGLGRTGASMGLALGRNPEQFERTGFDWRKANAVHALKSNAIDRIEDNLTMSVKNAQVILLAMPMHRVRETLQGIAAEVREESVFLDTSPARASVAAWVKEIIPTRCHYVGINASLNPRIKLEQGEDIQSARADLFENGIITIAAAPGTPSGAIDLAADLAGLIGARPFFCDLAEMDGLTAAMKLVPQLISTTLLNASLGQPAWRDAIHFAGREFESASSGIAGREESASLREAVLLNRTDLMRSLDIFLAALQALQSDIENEQGDSLEKKLEAARTGRQKWLKEYNQAGRQDDNIPGIAMPKAGDYWKQQFGFLLKHPAEKTKPPEKKD